jgi:hypothetical protein
MIYNIVSWSFEINVREGKPGFANDESYESCEYKSFEECYKNYIDFVPRKQWKYLRNVQSEYIV